ncbi:MAG: SAM-dependent chlorinase/fluorinase [Chlorobiaceae bacterium]|nr:SAM-dependent chlorinase/fluorinase [Chlorobiaceae bacterium]
MKEERTIVLMTDFGLGDTFVGQMKGVIRSIAPSAVVIDLTHAVSPQNIAQGAFLLGKSLPYFPAGSIFVTVVDPGVGTSRRAIAVETAKHIFVSPDNGLLSPVLQHEKVVRCVRISESRFMLPVSSSTFHGRDLFSPVAAHLSTGLPVAELGQSLDPGECVRRDQPACSLSADGKVLEGIIIYADHFGNLVTSIETGTILEPKRWEVECGNISPMPLSLTYGSVPEGAPLAYRGSSGTVEIGLRNGNAAQSLGLQPGDIVRLKRT